MSMIAIIMVGETEVFGWYIALYEKSYDVASIAELFYFSWSALLIFHITVYGTKASSDKFTDC